MAINTSTTRRPEQDSRAAATALELALPPARYKSFPPGLGNLHVPVAPAAAAAASLTLYTACRPATLRLQRAAWLAVRAFGGHVLPGRARAWQPAMGERTWNSIAQRLHAELGGFDALAFREPTQARRPGLMLLLFRRSAPVAFVKLRPASTCGGFERKVRVLEALHHFGPGSFSTMQPLASGEVAGWHYVATTPLPPVIHRAPKQPPLAAISEEICRALDGVRRPAGIPPHWVPMHGDLTPWNLRQLPGGELVLFDWEDSGWGPPGADEVLYLASAAALRGTAAASTHHREAVAYWQERLGERVAEDARDRRLAHALRRALATMAPPLAPATPATGRPRVLVFAYACEPDRGSEPGAGWGVVSTVAGFADCTVLVGPEHAPGLERWKSAHPDSSATFVTVPEPRWASLAKRHRVPWFLLYLSWMRRAHRVGRALHAERGFDAVYHATYSTYWLPSAAAHFELPVVWGPVGGGVTTPRGLWPLLGVKGLLAEWLDWLAVRVSDRVPATRRTWRRASRRLLQNEETRERLPPSLRAESTLLNHVLFIDPPPPSDAVREPFLLFFAHLESRKGPGLALRALAHTPPDVRMVMVGDGPQRRALERLARELGIMDRVEFRGLLPRPAIFELLGRCAAAVFTGLREEGGVALAEAMLSGTPVIVLANGGARTVAAAATDPSRVELVEPGSVAHTVRRMADAMTRMSRSPSAATGPLLDQAAAQRTLRRVVESALQRSP